MLRALNIITRPKLWYGWLTGKQPSYSIKTILVGLDAGGKTTFLYRIKKSSEEVMTTIPTIGFNVESLEIDFAYFTCWDIGGCDKIRPLWRHYTDHTELYIYMVDSNDIERLEQARDELLPFLRESPKACLLILANKQDFPHAKSPAYIAEYLLKDSLASSGNHQLIWHVIGTSMADRHHPGCQAVQQWLQQFAHWKQQQQQQYDDGHSNRMLLPFPISSSTTWLASNGNDDKKATTTEAASDKVEVQQVTKTIHMGNEDDDNDDNQAAMEKKLIEQQRQQVIILTWQQWLTRAAEAEAVQQQQPISTEGSASYAGKILYDFASCQLDLWDHYTHVQVAAAFFLSAAAATSAAVDPAALTATEARPVVNDDIDDRKDISWQASGKARILAEFPVYIQQRALLLQDATTETVATAINTAAKSFHYTMTCFWCDLLVYWIERWMKMTSSKADTNMQPASFEADFVSLLQFIFHHRNISSMNDATAATDDKLPVSNTKVAEEMAADDIVDKSVFRNYYTNEVIFSSLARKEYVARNLKALPTVL